MKTRIAVFGALGGLLIALLRLAEYRWLVVEHSLEIYGGVVAALFAAIGISLGVRLNRSRERIVVREAMVPVPAAAAPEPAPQPQPQPQPQPVDENDPTRAVALGVTPRELEILGLMAAGMSNREIAERLFVSENTVKTHSSRLFEKLGARRRTQAVQLGRQHALIP